MHLSAGLQKTNTDLIALKGRQTRRQWCGVALRTAVLPRTIFYQHSLLLVGPMPRQRMGCFNEVSGPPFTRSMLRRFTSPWTAERIPGSYFVKDATVSAKGGGSHGSFSRHHVEGTGQRLRTP